jgi:hypothetical protein
MTVSTMNLEERMTVDNAVAKPKSLGRRLGKGFFVLVVSLVLLYSAVRLVWRFSGSNEWELVRNENGIQVYSLKEPGTDLTQFKGVVRVNSSLNRIVAWLQDPETCRDARCVDPRTLAQVDDQLQYVSMQFNMPFYLRRREFVMRARFHQIPSTKEIWAEYAAAPDKAPASDCCFRVTDMNNMWRITPLQTGQIEIEYTMNMDWGGFLPDVLSNRIRPRYMYNQLRKIEGYVNREKYRTAKYDFIQEPTSTAAALADTPPVTGQVVATVQ